MHCTKKERTHQHQNRISLTPPVTQKIVMTDPELCKSLRDNEKVELVVFGSRLRCFHQDAGFIEDGRPFALRNINISTWSLLSSSIKDYRNGLLSYKRKFVLIPLLLFYMIIFLPAFLPYDIFWVAQLCLIPAILFWIVVLRHLVAKYLKNEAHPAVQRVVDELRPAISDCGFEVEYVVDPGWRRSTLLFIRKEEAP